MTVLVVKSSDSGKGRSQLVWRRPWPEAGGFATRTVIWADRRANHSAKENNPDWKETAFKGGKLALSLPQGLFSFFGGFFLTILLRSNFLFKTPQLEAKMPIKVMKKPVSASIWPDPRPSASACRLLEHFKRFELGSEERRSQDKAIRTAINRKQ